MTPDEIHARVVDQYTQHVNPYLAKLMNFAGFGVEIRAQGCLLIDHEGREYLDFLGGYGVFSFGHSHPVIVDAVRRQLDEMALSGKVFFNPRLAELAERLTRIAPRGLEYVFFSNSGAEAVEAALKFAKGATGRSKIISTEGSYHGKTLGALSTTGREKYRKPFEPLMPGAEFVPFGCFDSMTRAVDGQTAAVIIEPIQGEGGIHVAPEGYLTLIRELCDRHGALMIADEVQTGLGRTGKLFGCDLEGVKPDLMTLAKALGGGIMPIGATLGTAAVWEKIYSENPLAHTSTFGGNPLACAAAIAALEVLEADCLADRAEQIGEMLKSRLQLVQAMHPDLVTEVRGRGLMLGVEFAMDEVGELAIAQMTKRGLVAAYTLNNPRVIRFEPPLILEEEQLEQAIQIFDEALTEVEDILAALV